MVGHFLALGIWPLIMGFSMFLQMKMNPEPADPVQKTMFAYMPVIFTFMLGSFPAGLVIYWTWNNTLTVLQQSLIMKRAGREGRTVRQSEEDVPVASTLGQVSDTPAEIDATEIDPTWIEAGRKLFAGAVRFLLRRRQAGRPAADRRAGDRLRRPLQCRQVVA